MTTRSERSPLIPLVFVLGLGLLAAAYALWSLEADIRANRSLLMQQQQTVSALLGRDAANTRALSDQQRLTRALQAQVLKLGGTPLLQPPSPAASPTARPSSPAVSATPQPSAGPRPSPKPRPTPTPAGSPQQSPTPSPSPSPTCRVKVGPICL